VSLTAHRRVYLTVYRCVCLIAFRRVCLTAFCRIRLPHIVALSTSASAAFVLAMERQKLEMLPLAELKKEILKHGLQPVNSRAHCIDLLLDYFDANAHDTIGPNGSSEKVP